MTADTAIWLIALLAGLVGLIGGLLLSAAFAFYSQQEESHARHIDDHA